VKYKELNNVYYKSKEEFEELYSSRINSESAYVFDFFINDYNAFVVINPEILEKVENIMSLNQELFIKMNAVPPIALNQYANKCLIDEVKMTNDIEGVLSTRKEIGEILQDKVKGKKNRLYGLVKKYGVLKEKEVIKLETNQNIRSLYDELVLYEVVEEDDENIPDGHIFRKGRVSVRNSFDVEIHQGLYPEKAIIENMTKSLNILNNEKYNFFIRIAVFHYMFGYVHPFYDGNGRLSRFISSYLLSRKLEYLVSYKLSYTIKQNIKTYYKSFKSTNDEHNRGDLTIFVMKFLDFIYESLNDLVNALEERISKLNYYVSYAEKICGKDEKMIRIVFILVQESLFGYRGLGVEELQKVSGVGMSKTRSTLKYLNEKKLVRKNKEGNKILYNMDLDTMKTIE